MLQIIDYEIVMRGIEYQGASSGMEYFAANQMMYRLCMTNFRMDIIITDRDGKILQATKKYYPDIKNMHCAAHMLKNFQAKIRNSDLPDPTTNKTLKPSLKSNECH
jgi:chemotaxis methyl-accepting protein methylase